MMQSLKERPIWRVVVSEFRPWTYLHQFENGTFTITGGAMKKVLDMLSETLQFDYKLYVSEDNMWGRLLPNGSFNGMIGMLQRNEVDFGLGPFTPTYARLKVVDFADILIMFHLRIFGASTTEKKPSVFNYVLTFDLQIWVALFVAMIVTVLVSSFVDIPISSTTRMYQNFKSKLSKYFWAYLGSIFCEAMPMNPANISVRILFAVWWIAILVLMNAFSGHMKAIMMTPPEQDRIDSLSSLARRPHIRPIIIKGSAYELYFKTSATDLLRAIWDMMVKNNGLIFANDIFNTKNLEDVRTGKSVFISDDITLKDGVGAYCREIKNGAFYFGKESFLPHVVTVSYRKTLDKDIKGKINKVIRWFFRTGAFQRQFSRIDYDFGKCIHELPLRERSLKIEDMEGVFILWFTGLVIAAIVLIVECIWNHVQNKK